MGSWLDKLKGRVKKTAGEVTRDRKLEAAGRRDIVKGEVKGKAERAKRSVEDASARNRRRR